MKKILRTAKLLPVIMVTVMLFNLALPFTVYAQDTTPTETPPAPTETATESTPTVEPTREPTPVAEVILTEAPQGTALVVVDSTGDTLPLDSPEAAQIIATVDPMWCPEGSQPNDTGCSTSMSPLELLADMRANPDKYASNGVIYFDNTNPITSAFVLDDSETSLGTTYNSLNSFNLNLFGGWNGGATNTFDGQTLFSGPNAFITIGNLYNPWLGKLALNNIRVNGSESSDSGIEINASNVELNNVDSSYNAGNGITVNAPEPGNVELNNVTAIENAGSGVAVNGNDTTVNVNGGNFDKNSSYGIDANNSLSTSIPLGNAWTDADDYAPGSVVTLSGNDNRLNGQNLGFIPGENVHVDVTGPNGYTAECDDVAGPNGQWSCQIELWNSDLAVGEYTFTANGLTSQISVQGTFTDARTITSATLNGSSSVTVGSRASITAVVNVTTDAVGGNSNWRCTGWRISTTAPGTTTRVNHTNHDGNGNYSEAMTITAPSAAGTYNAYFIAYSNDSCSQGASTVYTMTGAVIVKTTPTITWSNPANINYGTALSGTQLKATASVPGTFVYTPPAGTILNAGNSQNLHVDFTPNDTLHYNNTSKDVKINVLKLTPVITFGTAPTPTYLGGNFTVSATTTNTDSSSLTYSRVSGPCARVSGATFSSSGAGTCVVRASGAATTNFNAATKNQSVTIAKATPVITFGTAPTPTYLGGNFTVSATTTNTDSSSLTFSRVSGPCARVSGATFSSSGAGTCVVRASGAATTNFNAATKNQSVTIAKATPVITWSNPANITYPTALSGTQLNATTVPAAGTRVYTPGTGTVLNAGAGQILHVEFTPTDTTNYANASKDVIINVSKINATCTVSGYTGVYDGSPHGASGSCTGIGGVTLSGLSLGSTFMDAPGGTAHWTFSNINYNDQNGDAAIMIAKTNATCAINGYSGIYDNTAHGASGSCTGVGGMTLSGLALGATFTSVPGGTAHWVFSNVNYHEQSGDAAIVISQASPLITWSNPADIVYGTPLSSTHLNASANTTGTFLYTPSTGTILNAGTSQTLHVEFSPDNPSNYSSATANVTIHVLKDDPILTWGNPAAIVYGKALSVTELNATADVPGNFLYTPAMGTILNAGAGQTLHVDFSPTDTINYNSVSTDVLIDVLKATPVITFGLAPTPTYLNGNFMVNATTTNTDSSLLIYSAVSGPCDLAGGNDFHSNGAGLCVVRATGAESTNFLGASAEQRINVKEPESSPSRTSLNNIIPVTGGKLVDLKCNQFSTLMTPNGYKAEFLVVLCGYKASLTEEQPAVLPAPVPGIFVGALTVNLVQGGTSQNLLSGEAGLRLTIPMVAGANAANYKVIFWDSTLNSGAGGWIDLPIVAGDLSSQNSHHQVISGLTITNAKAQFTVNFVGTFVIVQK